MKMNSIELYIDTGGLQILTTGDIKPIFSGEITIVDTCMIFPAIKSRDKRNVNSLKKYSEKLNPLRETDDKHILRKLEDRSLRKCIRIVNAIEDGSLSKRGLYMGITRQVELELWDLRNFRSEYDVPENWMGDIMKYLYYIDFNTKVFRKEYGGISRLFSSDGDFSVALVAYVLGLSLATRDYRDFNPNTIRSFGKMYSERWGLKRSFKKHDPESLCTIMDSLQL
jgi:hypothetical protein